jgi:hypothetical protein
MKNGKLHVGLIVLICLVPVLIVLALPALGINLGGGAWILLILLCPLAHLLMMRYMHGPGHTEAHTHERQASQSVQEVESGEGSSVNTEGDARLLLPAPAVNKLPVPVLNRQPDRSSAD